MTALCMGCGSTDDIKAPVLSTASDEGAGAETEEAGASLTEVTLEETEIYNANGLIVTVTGLEEGFGETDVMLSIQNNSDQNILLTADLCSVNGYMMSTASLYAEVAAGKASNDKLCIYDSSLQEAGIDTMAQLQFYLNVQNGDTWDSLDKTDLITLTTSAGADYQQAADDSGDVVYDSNGVRVICKGLQENWLWDGNIVFYMDNQSDRAVTVYAENVSVNGYMEDVSFWSELRAGTRAVESMYLLDLADLNLESIDDIQSVEFTLRLVDESTWEEIATTDPITLTFE